MAENDSSPSIDDSHTALNRMPKQQPLRRLTAFGVLSFSFSLTAPDAS